MFENQMNQPPLQFQSLTAFDGSTLPAALLSQHPVLSEIDWSAISAPHEEGHDYGDDEGLGKNSSVRQEA